jgi:hypothetical protein
MRTTQGEVFDIGGRLRTTSLPYPGVEGVADFYNGFVDYELGFLGKPKRPPTGTGRG